MSEQIQEEEKQVDSDHKELWKDSEFDSDRAKRLVTNLRDEIAELKQELSEYKTTATTATERVKTLEEENTSFKEQLATRDKELQESVKKNLLSARGLPTNLISALAGESEEDWTEMADMLASLRGESGAGKDDGYKPDPVQSAKDSAPAGDAEKIAEAKALGLL